jgi:plasmid stabilization system protein ParE
MNHELRISSRAEAEAAAAFDWYEQRSPGLGVDFIRCADATISVVQRSPQLFRKRHGEIRLAMTPRFPFAIYFIWDEAAGFVSIRRILHFAQNAPAHLDR